MSAPDIKIADGQEVYFARDSAVMGCRRKGEQHTFVLIATVNPNIKSGNDVASDIADALNLKFKTEKWNV